MGSRTLLLASALCAAIGTGAPAFAQSTADRCRTMPTDAERFACLEEALAAAEAALAGSGAETPPAGGVADQDRGRRDIPLPGGTGNAGAPAAPGPDRTYDAGAPAAAVVVASSDAPLQAEIVSYREIVPGQWQFELSNGEVWRQGRGDGTLLHLYGSDPVRVEMWRSWASGYRMRLLELNRVIQVDRVR